MHQFLLDYRTTPHTTTGVPPATILFGRSLRTKLPHISETPQKDASVRQRNTAQKQKMKEYADKKAYVQPSKFKEGDAVLLKNPRPFNSTPYKPIPLIITRKKGTMITAQRGQQQVTRNSSFFKKSPHHPTREEAGLEPPATSEDEENHLRAETSHTNNTPNLNQSHNQPNSIQTSVKNTDPVTSATHTNPVTSDPRRSTRTTKLPKKFYDFVLK